MDVAGVEIDLDTAIFHFSLALGAAVAYFVFRRAGTPAAAARDSLAPLRDSMAPPALPSPEQLGTLIRGRRSVFPKDYTGEAVPRDVIERALEAASWAPTHGKTEPWRFTVFHGADAVARWHQLKLDGMRASMSGDELDAALTKAERKKKELKNVSAIISLGVKRVASSKGKLQPEWEEIASMGCAVQNLHLSLEADGYHGYWSSGGVNGWAECDGTRAVLGLDDAVDGQYVLKDGTPVKENDRVLGFFFVGCKRTDANYRMKREPVAEKTTWIE